MSDSLSQFAGSVKDITDLVNKFMSPAAKEAGELGALAIRGIRLKQELALQRALADLEKRGHTPKPVNLRILVPLLEAAGLEEDDDMSERWASLLSSAADPTNKSSLESSFIEILNQLAPQHAFVLDVFYDQVERSQLPPEKWTQDGYIHSNLKSFLQDDVPLFDVAIENLLRMRLIALPIAKLGMANGVDVVVQVVSSDILCPTSLGHALVTACGRSRTPKNHVYSVPANSISNIYWTQGGSIRLWTKAEEENWERFKARGYKN